MKRGAFHYVNKPVDLVEMARLAERALETTELRREGRALRGSQWREYSFDAIIGSSRPSRAPSRCSVVPP